LASGRSVCPLCRARRGKRHCPAKGESICAHCCGTKRRVEIRCPDDCAYLDGSHAGAWEGRETEKRRDARRLAPHLQGLTEDQLQHLFRGVRAIVEMRRRGVLADDRLLGDALSTRRKTLETRARGVLYEHRAEDARAERVIAELDEVFLSEEGDVAAPSDGDLLAVAVALDDCVASILAEGGEPATFLDTAQRLVGEMGEPAPAADGPLIIEP
jgi:hypothetical protein